MKFRRRQNDEPRPDEEKSKKKKGKSGKNKKNSDAEKEESKKKKDSPEKKRERAREGATNPDLAVRLREWGENYGLEEDPYLEGLSDAIEKGKNLASWASHDVMTLLPQPLVGSTEGAIYSAMVLVRNVLVFVPVALTWLAVGKATTGFSLYTARSSAASVVNFLQFWQNGYGVLAKIWTLSHIAEDDFYIIATVIFLTFVTPFMNRSAVKRAERFEHDAMRERLSLVIEVEGFLFNKRHITPLTMDSALVNSLEHVVQATTSLNQASKRIEIGMKSLPRQIENGSANLNGQAANSGKSGKNKQKEKSEKKDKRKKEVEEAQRSSTNVPALREKSGDQTQWLLQKIEADRVLKKEEHARIEQAASNLDQVAQRVDVIVQSLPRRAHARKELKKIEEELAQTRSELLLLHNKMKSQKKKIEKQQEWKAAKREAERNKAAKSAKSAAEPQPSFLVGS